MVVSVKPLHRFLLRFVKVDTMLNIIKRLQPFSVILLQGKASVDWSLSHVFFLKNDKFGGCVWHYLVFLFFGGWGGGRIVYCRLCRILLLLLLQYVSTIISECLRHIFNCHGQHRESCLSSNGQKTKKMPILCLKNKTSVLCVQRCFKPPAPSPWITFLQKCLLQLRWKAKWTQ